MRDVIPFFNATIVKTEFMIQRLGDGIIRAHFKGQLITAKISAFAIIHCMRYRPSLDVAS